MFVDAVAVAVVVDAVAVVVPGVPGRSKWLQLPGNYKHWNWELPTGEGRGMWPWGLWIQKPSHDDDGSGLLMVIDVY